MSQQSIRFKDGTIQLTVDGRKLLGSFTRFENLSVTPDAEVVKSQHAGEKRQRNDLDVRGYDFSFTVKESGKEWQDLWRRFEQADENGTPFPTVSITATSKYRDGAGTGQVVLHDEVILKLDSREATQGDYTKLSWSGSCRRMRTS